MWPRDVGLQSIYCALYVADDRIKKYYAPQEESEHMWAIFWDVPQEQYGPESGESGGKTPLISQGFSHGRGPGKSWRKWSRWWVTKENVHKQTEAAK